MDRWFWVWVVVVALFQFLEGVNGMDVKWSDSGVKVEKIVDKEDKKPATTGSVSDMKGDDGPKGVGDAEL